MSSCFSIQKNIINLGIVSAIILTGIILYQQFLPDKKSSQQEKAIIIMEEMLYTISEYCYENDIYIDTMNDPGKTGLIGPEWTDMTTTIGHLEAKRTTIQPEFASLMIELLAEAGVNKNDTIAIGCSGSFPGLLLASLSAAKAAGIKCKTVLSLGSSSFGANRTNLNILTIYNILYNKGLIDKPPLAVSLGGENDSGEGWGKAIYIKLTEDIVKSGYLFINKPNLKESVFSRDSLYNFDNGSSIKAFINSGGAMANIGTSPTILGLKPGLVRKHKIPEQDQQGAIHRAMINDIPVIHLLNIKGLAMEYGLKWDPVIR
jgi:poly-gamma-glutamate system protein